MNVASTSSVPILHAGRQLQIEYQWHFAERDHAPLLIFLHEGLGSVSMWRDFPRQLCAAGGYRGLVYSRPGYGRSTPRELDEPLTPDFMHAQAREVLPALLVALGIDAASDPPWLFGHSDGGSIALLHAASSPERVRGAIVLAPHVFVEDLSVQSIAKAREAYLHTDLKTRLARHHVDVDSAFRGWNDIWLNPAFRDWNIEREVADIRCAVLAVQGVDDEYGTMAQIEAVARLLPNNTELLRLAACGHSPHRDQPDRVIQESLRWIKRHTPGLS